MKLLIISPFFYPHKGGSQQYMEDLHFYLMERHKNVNVDVLCYNTDKQPEVERYRNFTIYRVPSLNILPGQFALPNYLALFNLLKKLNRKNKYSYFISNTRFFDNSWWTPFVGAYLKTKTILADHCADHPTHPFFLVSVIAQFVDFVFFHGIAKFYTHLTVTNKATYQFYRNNGVNTAKIMYGGVNPETYKNTKKKNKKITITFLGRMIESKGPHLFVKAAKQILKTHKEVQFYVAGNGSLYRKLSVEKNKQIHFLGALPRNKVIDLLKQTDILIHPSLHHEGFPNVLLEAGSASCAVIATDMGSTNEIILDKKTGLLIEPTVNNIITATQLVLENQMLRKKLGDALYTHIEKHFSWKKIVPTYYRLLTTR